MPNPPFLRAGTWICAALVGLALSGCFGEAEPAEDTTSPTPTTSAPPTTATSPTTTTSPNATGPPPPPNEPPNATLEADPTNGTVPFNVTFTINATDPNGDPLEWTLDADEDGTPDAEGTETDLPANVTFEYTENGTFNATLNVSDGMENVVQVVLIEAKPGGGGAVFTDTAALSCTQCSITGANSGVGYRAGVSGIDSVFFELGPELVGLPFVADSSEGDPDLSFRTSCSGGGAVGDPFAEEGPESGTVPEGAACVLIWEFIGADSEITITIGTPPPEEPEA